MVGNIFTVVLSKLFNKVNPIQHQLVLMHRQIYLITYGETIFIHNLKLTIYRMLHLIHNWMINLNQYNLL